MLSISDWRFVMLSRKRFCISLAIALSCLFPRFSVSENASYEQQVDPEEILELQEKVAQLEANKGTSGFQSRLNAFNPSMTVFGNFLGCVGLEREHTHSHDDDHGHDHEHAPGHVGHHHDFGEDGFCKSGVYFRHLEIDLRAAIDPYARGVAILGFDTEGVHLEEAYMVITSLPGLDWSNWGFTLKGGKFLASFGRFNQIHTHDLPHIFAPRAQIAFLGEEGLSRAGVSFYTPVPTAGDWNALGLTLELLDGKGMPLAPKYDGRFVGGIGRLNWFFDMAVSHDFEVGASSYSGPAGTDDDTRLLQLYGADVHYRFRPSSYHSYLLGGEFYIANKGKDTSKWPLGLFAYTQYQFAKGVYLGLRYDFAPNPEELDEMWHAGSAYLTWYTSEFLRFRLGYEHVVTDPQTWGGYDTIMLGVTFVFGSHPVEPYWVNL